MFINTQLKWISRPILFGERLQNRFKTFFFSINDQYTIESRSVKKKVPVKISVF